jgi:hypothetical protein
MAGGLAVVAVAVGATIAASDSARWRSDRLRAPESWREVTVRAVMRVRVYMTPMSMGSPASGGAVHADKATRAPTALAFPFA